jgi:hypothetical protein
MVARSLPRATQAAVPIAVILARAEALPFPDHTFDTVVGDRTKVRIVLPKASRKMQGQKTGSLACETFRLLPAAPVTVRAVLQADLYET